ncbi:uncharacterized protein E0L32_008317 [Thyridium curvatum]|uniref:Uncharacterized protein n=1 Tax=Thyridium curvatum TaxID=1093900 RepID=A0A507B1A7_9PEZI|nr:uncharacterized protein E0L32_008317 [Thyridium curvatum]TPX10748.1 hypothetical protein E0L32_008317 [Thyridium curvatum]
MAYDGYQQQHQRPYNGPAAPRPPPQRHYPPAPQRGPPPQQYNAPQQYDQYQDDYGYGYDEYGGGGGGDYNQGYDRQYDDMNYRQGPPNQNYPPQDYPGPGPNGGGRGRPMPNQRGPPPRQMTNDGGRGPYPPRQGPPGPGRGDYPNGPPGGRGRGGPLDRSANSDPSMHRGRGPMQDPMSPQETGFGGSPFPTFPGQSRKTDLDQEGQILDQMSGLDISGRGPRQNGPPPQRGPMGPPGPGYGQRGPPQRGFTQDNYAHSDRAQSLDQGYGPSRDYPDDGYGPPGRTMTMPSMEPMRNNQGLPPRVDSAPYNGPAGRNMPPRPSTASGMRQPPQRPYPPNGGGPAFQEPRYGNGPSPQGYDQQQRPASFDNYDLYDSYSEPPANPEYHRSRGSQASTAVPDFDADPQQMPRNSFDQHMQQGGPGQPQRGPNRNPELNKTKSQPDLRQSQQAVFEMASDAPPMPNGFQQQGYPQGRRPTAPGLPTGPAPIRQHSGASSRSGGPDSLPSHPAPVRPGLMPNSLVSQMPNKPAPVRNYAGNTPPAGGMPAMPPPVQVQAAPARTETQQPCTPELLESLRNTIKADPNDQESALLLAKKLIEAMDVLAPGLPDPRSRGKARERYAMDAHKILKKLANAQNPDAMFFMADCLGRGVFGGAEPDNKEAFTWYQSAAKLGHAAAAYRTAVCCEIGNEEGGGTRKDPLKAIQWYKRAATLGDTPAMYKVGMILLKGLLGQPKNPREAISWLKRAAERADAENPHALHELGLLYESAQPNDAYLRDEAYAFQLFQQAAELGYKFSQYRMGCAYEYGLMGCPIDPRLSIMWYSKAAMQEEHQSELALSGWYLTGSEGVLQQSDTEAYLWARKAAMAGLAKAEYAMGYFTEVGIGVPANLEDAKRWYWRAAAQDFPKARERLEDLKRSGKNGPRQRERISRSKIGKQQEGECTVM